MQKVYLDAGPHHSSVLVCPMKQNGGKNMKKINLKSYYPYYASDCIVEVADEVYQVFDMFAQKEHADYQRRRMHKAYYSLDVGDGIENSIVVAVMSPQEIYERKLSNQELYAAISRLPEKQAKRIYAYYFMQMSKASIARAEAVSERAIWESIERGLKNISRFIKKNM